MRIKAVPATDDHHRKMIQKTMLRALETFLGNGSDSRETESDPDHGAL
jgi:hypothetical protein